MYSLVLFGVNSRKQHLVQNSSLDSCTLSESPPRKVSENERENEFYTMQKFFVNYDEIVFKTFLTGYS